MAVITQNYDIDMQATGGFPVVKMSQFDTGSRTIVFTVYDGRDLAHIDGMVARVDGTRSDGVEFSSSCTVGAGSKVSFTISQEMTKHAGKHAAELVIFDASGNPIGTQNFVIDVEAAPMVRDSAASADDRTLYDQYTDSVEQKFSTLSTSLTDTLAAKTDALTKTVQDIDALLGGSSTARTIINQNVILTLSGRQNECNVTLTYDPISGLVVLNVSSQLGIVGVPAGSHDVPVLTIPTEYLPSDDKYIGTNESGNVRRYVCAYDGLVTDGTTSDWGVAYCLKGNGQLFLRFKMVGGPDSGYEIGCSASWQARGGRYLGVNPIPTGSNTVTVGTTTAGEPGTQASVVNSGTAKDVVLDFTIPTADLTADMYGPAKGSVQISKESDASAAYNDSIAIGSKALATSEAVAIGLNAKAKGSLGVAIGKNASAAGLDSVAIGAAAANLYSVAIGYGAKANAQHSVAIGEDSIAAEPYTVSIDYSAGNGKRGQRRLVGVADPVNAQDAATKAYVDSHAASGGYTLPAATASTLGGVKVGDNLTVAEDGTLSADGGVTEYGTDSIAIGTTPGTSATTTNTVSIGANASTANDGCVAVGTTAATGGFGNTIIGSGAIGKSNASTVIGYQAATTTTDGTSGGTAVGFQASADNYGMAFGQYAHALKHASVAIGTNASVSDNGRSGIAIGDSATVTAQSSVALGSGATASDMRVVSVGSDAVKRRVVNVADPANAQDAATKAYVDALIAKLKSDNNLN